MNYIFQHIPKCGGTSIRLALLNAYGERAYFCPHWRTRATLDVPEGMTWEKELFIGHCLHGIHTELPHIGYWEYITWLRDPVERVISHYHWHLSKNFLNYSLWDCPRWFKDLDDFITSPEFTQSHNLMTRMISGDLRYEDPDPPTMPWSPDTENNLVRAKAFIADDYFYIGCLEKNDLCWGTLCHLLGIQYEKLKHLQRRTMKVNVSPEQRKEILAQNDLDVQLYEYCREKFQWEM